MASPNAPYPFTTSFHLVSTPFGVYFSLSSSKSVHRPSLISISKSARSFFLTKKDSVKFGKHMNITVENF